MVTSSHSFKLSDFKFSLPSSLIAKYPIENRDESRLMVVDGKTGNIEHLLFKEIINYFTENDTFVFNNTKVYPAKLKGYKESTNAPVEVLLLREIDEENRIWDVIIEPARKIRIGNKILFGETDVLIADVLDNTTSKGRIIRFLSSGDNDKFKQRLLSFGEMPIPVELKRQPEQIDKDRFQTIFAKVDGAILAASAGLHFSREVLKRMEIIGINKGFITLHIGICNSQAPNVGNLAKHKSDSEYYKIPEKTATLVNKSKLSNGQICAVGISSLRAIESSITTQGLLQPIEGWTNKFIYPPYSFGCATSLITNFHMPLSPLIMAATAFGGYNNVMKAYELAIKDGYRFGVYGDAMLIVNNQ